MKEEIVIIHVEEIIIIVIISSTWMILNFMQKNDDDLEGLLATVKRFSDDINMEFGLDKCAKATFKRGRLTSTTSITLNDNTKIKDLDQEGAYKYLGVNEGKGIQHNAMKEKIRKEYYRRIRSIMKTELNSRNRIQAINSLAVPVVQYSFNIINWNLSDLQRMDTKTRKLMTANRMHHPKADIDRIYLPRKEGGRGLIQLEMSYKTTTIGLDTYIQNNYDWMIQLVNQHERNKKLHSVTKEAQRYRRELNLEDSDNVDATIPTKAAKSSKGKAKQEILKRMLNHWQEKPLHGQYPKRTKEAYVDQEKTHQWLCSSGLKAEAEGFLLAAQDQCLLTRNYQANILHNGVDPKCRLCDENIETIDHIISGCSKLAATEYVTRHDRIGQYLHWNICCHYEIPHPTNWYEHHPQPVTEGDNVTILWDFTIHTDRQINANRPDIVIKDLKQKTCFLIDLSVSADRNISVKEYEKLAKYKDLEIEIGRMWQLRTITLPIVVGALGMLKKGSSDFIDQIPGKSNICEVQKIALTSTAHLLRKFLSM